MYFSLFIILIIYFHQLFYKFIILLFFDRTITLISKKLE